MHDIEQDLQDIYALLRAALSGGSDVEIFKALQIHRGDVPEAVKTLQRAVLEDNTIHREFIESGIDALKRMSVTLPLPSWTITRYVTFPLPTRPNLIGADTKLTEVKR